MGGEIFEYNEKEKIKLLCVSVFYSISLNRNKIKTFVLFFVVLFSNNNNNN
jgi:hypothetical protein